jgi:hypothetical protein
VRNRGRTTVSDPVYRCRRLSRRGHPEEIVEQYPAISRGQIHAVIAYFLAHTSEADDYLRIRGRRVAEVRQANQRRFDPAGISARLMARRRGGFRVIRLLGDENLETPGVRRFGIMP